MSISAEREILRPAMEAKLDDRAPKLFAASGGSIAPLGISVRLDALFAHSVPEPLWRRQLVFPVMWAYCSHKFRTATNSFARSIVASHAISVSTAELTARLSRHFRQATSAADRLHTYLMMWCDRISQARFAAENLLKIESKGIQSFPR